MLTSVTCVGRQLILFKRVGQHRRGSYLSVRAMSLAKISFGENLTGYAGGGKVDPAVIVLQEWWGVTEEIKAQAEHIGKLGPYRVLVPDLYKGKVGVDAEEASHLMNNLDFNEAVKEIAEAAKFLRAEGAPKVGVTGFCMGGALTLLAAEHAGVDAAAPFYGTPPAELSHPENIKVPVQAHTGENDKYKGFADPETVKGVVDKINAAGGTAELFVYPGEEHAFMNAGENIFKLMKTANLPAGSKQSQELAWSRLEAFFAKYLKAA
eukprot:jgi/Botrbrau1/6571/Bobra.40_2s0034.2